MTPTRRATAQGMGCLVVPLMLVGLIAASIIQVAFPHSAVFTSICWIAGCLLSAVLIRSVGRRLNRDGDVHLLFDLPMQNYFWLGIGFAVAALVTVLVAAVLGTS